MVLRRALPEDAELIHDLARIIWPPTFKEILSKEQLSYMLDWMYAPDTLRAQITDGHEFYIVEDSLPLGFMGIELNHPKHGFVKIHKLYVLPECQGKGFGKALIDHAMSRGREEGMHTLLLNVNRYNKAVSFYKKIGFTIDREEDIGIGKGYLMEDYVMSYDLMKP
jgi:ribosomal protein S18 acetylase RimI-like enzyme